MSISRLPFEIGGGSVQCSLRMGTEGTTSEDKLSVDCSEHHPCLITSLRLKGKIQLPSIRKSSH